MFHGALFALDAFANVQVLAGKVSGYLSQSIGLNLPSDESVMVKACTTLGALSNIFVNRELMHMLTDFDNPLPDSRLCQLSTGAARELVNTSVLALTGTGIGYVAGKGIEGGARAVCSGVNLTIRGVMACITRVKVWSGDAQNIAEPAHPLKEETTGHQNTSRQRKTDVYFSRYTDNKREGL